MVKVFKKKKEKKNDSYFQNTTENVTLIYHKQKALISERKANFLKIQYISSNFMDKIK